MDNNNLPKFNNEPDEMPKLDNDNMPNISATNGPKNIIEIPKEYYETIAKEEQDARKQEEQILQKETENKETSHNFNSMIFLSLLSVLIIAGSLLITVNVTSFALLIIPLYIIFGSIFEALKAKKENKESIFPQTILVGGMVVAVASFAISTSNESKIDLWTYYIIASTITGFLGIMVSSIITKIITKGKEIKALESLAYILFLVLLVGTPSYLYITHKDDFYKYIFHKQIVPNANNEEEFTMKTLKNRYGKTFDCGGKVKHALTKDNRKVVQRICEDENGIKANINSIAYNEGNNEYIVMDNYFDNLILENIKKDITSIVSKAVMTEKVKVFLYPEDNCSFIGDCVECEEYFKTYKSETDIDNRFKASNSLNLTEYLSLTPKEFINTNKFKIIISSQKHYNQGTKDYENQTNKILEELNKNGYKNNYGYEITLNHQYDENDSENSLIDTVYKVVGKKTDDATFKDPKVVVNKD